MVTTYLRANAVLDNDVVSKNTLRVLTQMTGMLHCASLNQISANVEFLIPNNLVKKVSHAFQVFEESFISQHSWLVHANYEWQCRTFRISPVSEIQVSLLFKKFNKYDQVLKRSHGRWCVDNLPLDIRRDEVFFPKFGTNSIIADPKFSNWFNEISKV